MYVCKHTNMHARILTESGAARARTQDTRGRTLARHPLGKAGWRKGFQEPLRVTGALRLCVSFFFFEAPFSPYTSPFYMLPCMFACLRACYLSFLRQVPKPGFEPRASAAGDWRLGRQATWAGENASRTLRRRPAPRPLGEVGW